MLRMLALVAAGAGGLGSVALLLQMGRRNSSLALLVFFFSVWVVSPFLGLVFAIMRSKRWTETIRKTLYFVTITVAIASVLIYTRVIDLKPASSANTFLFVAVPPATWVFIVAILSIATLAARSQSRRSGAGS